MTVMLTAPLPAVGAALTGLPCGALSANRAEFRRLK
jgi:hypothetical protein